MQAVCKVLLAVKDVQCCISFACVAAASQISLSPVHTWILCDLACRRDGAIVTLELVELCCCRQDSQKAW